MKAVGKEEDIKTHLDKALASNSTLICILKKGLTESERIYDNDAVLYTRIEFKPQFYYRGYYSGHMFNPNGKYQGLMAFGVKSFESVVCLEED